MQINSNQYKYLTSGRTFI